MRLGTHHDLALGLCQVTLNVSQLLQRGCEAVALGGQVACAAGAALLPSLALAMDAGGRPELLQKLWCVLSGALNNWHVNPVLLLQL